MSYVIHGQGAVTLRHVPVDHDGRARVVASATYEILDLRFSDTSSDRVVSSGSATLGGVGTTTTAAAGPGETDTDLVSLASVAGVSTASPYLLSADDGTAELVSLRAVDGLDVYTHLELRHDYAVGSAFRSVEIHASFPQTEADDDAEIQAAPHPYEVRWTYDVDGETHVVPRVYWLSRTTVVPPVTELDVLRAYPTIGPRLRNRASVSDAIAVATDDYQAEIRASGRSPVEFRGNDTARVAVRARALEYALRWCGPAQHDVDEADRFRSQYQYLMTQLLSGVPRPETITVPRTTDTGTQDSASTHPLFTRR